MKLLSIYTSLFKMSSLWFGLQNGIPLTDPNFYASVSKKKLAEILKSDTDYDIPMLDQRVDVLNEAGKVLMEVTLIWNYVILCQADMKWGIWHSDMCGIFGLLIFASVSQLCSFCIIPWLFAMKSHYCHWK